MRAGLPPEPQRLSYCRAHLGSAFNATRKSTAPGWPRRLLGNILISFQKNFTGKMSVIRSGTHCPVRHRNGSIHSSGSFEKSLIGENNYVNRFNIARPIG
jgi:hypothetical protein